MFEHHKKKITKKINDRMIRLARHAINVLIDESPVWTGEYVKSMKVGIKAMVYQRATTATPPPYPPQIDGTALKATEKNNLTRAVELLIEAKTKKIVFGNSSPHANFVEYLGWETKGPHFVFGKARESTRLRK